MPRNMVSGKPSNRSARQVDILTTTCIWFFWLLDSTCGNTCCKGNQEYGFCSRAIDVRPAHIGCAYGPAVAWVALSMTRNERQTVASELSLDVPSVCVRFTLQG
jgi:hypothetical protein